MNTGSKSPFSGDSRLSAIPKSKSRVMPLEGMTRLSMHRARSESAGTKAARALRASRQGDASPWIPIFWGLGVWDFSLCLADALFVDDRPPTHFFFTKKAYCGNQTICVAESRKSVQT